MTASAQQRKKDWRHGPPGVAWTWSTPARMGSRASVVLALAVLVFASVATPASAETIGDLFERVHRSVVVIRALEMDVPAEKGEGPSISSVGSGVLISTDGKILTAAHLVHAASEITVEFWDGRRVSARVMSSAPGADISLLQAEAVPADVVEARLADSHTARIGDEVFVIGAPYGLSHTLTVGHLSGRQKPGQTTASLAHAEFLQTDAAINKGNSGGPMFNMAGEVLGITRAALIGLRRLSAQDVAGAAARGRVITGSSRMRSVRPAARMPSSPADMKAGA
jgi:S1-C subfamily serine protease